MRVVGRLTATARDTVADAMSWRLQVLVRLVVLGNPLDPRDLRVVSTYFPSP